MVVDDLHKAYDLMEEVLQIIYKPQIVSTDDKLQSSPQLKPVNDIVQMVQKQPERPVPEEGFYIHANATSPLKLFDKTEYGALSPLWKNFRALSNKSAFRKKIVIEKGQEGAVKLKFVPLKQQNVHTDYKVNVILETKSVFLEEIV